MSNDLFVPSTTIDPNKDYFPEVLEKYKDNAGVARAVVEKELHIKNIEGTLTELRADLVRREAIEEATKLLTKQPPATTEQDEGNPSDRRDDQRVQIKPEEISRLIQTEITRISSEQTQASNVALVQNELVKAFGSDYVPKLEAKAKELGLSKDWLTEVAKTQPKAFLSLVGLSSDTPRPVVSTPSLFTPSTAGVNTAALGNRPAGSLPKEETYAFWQQVRKDDPKYYYSVPAARMRDEAVRKHGDAFFG